jgi:rhodanese-related sulfurtransferase
MTNISPEEVKERMGKGEKLHLVDVRQPDEVEEYNIGGIALPLGEIQSMNTEDIDHLKNEEIILYCRSGNRSGIAARFLDQMGFSNTKNLVGGMLAWRQKFGE